MRHYDGKVVPAKDPMGRQVYWYTVAPVESTEETSDRWAFDNGYVSITPLRLERIRDVEPKVQAWTFLDEKHALEQARAADERKRSGKPIGSRAGRQVEKRAQ